MATTSHDSGSQLEPSPDVATPHTPGGTGAPSATAKLPIDTVAGAPQRGVWLDGNVIACACPECHAPVAIRAWLMMGDCNRCGTSVELTEEQEREVRRLLADRERPAATAPAPPVAKSPHQASPQPPVQRAPTEPVAQAVAPAPMPTSPAPQQRRATTPTTPPPQVAPPPAPPTRVRAATRPFGAQVRVYKLATVGAARVYLHDMLRDLPAWLASLIVHLVLIILLGLWVVESKVVEPEIALSATLGPHHQAGERAISDPVRDDVEITDPGEPPVPHTPQDVAQAKKDAQELQATPNDPAPALPQMAKVLRSLAKPGGEVMFAGRDPRVRSRMVNSEGGTTFTEAAVARGLRWLAKHQQADGSWSLHGFHSAGDCNGQCDGQGHESDTGATSLALLPFLGAGQTHLHGRYTNEVAGGLRFLIAQQLPNGDLRGRGIGRMYAHAQSAIVLCEAFAISGDEQLRQPAQRALDFIVAAQHRQGGWRYSPGDAGDTSVVGWQLMALRSGQMAELSVPDETVDRVTAYLDRAQADRVGGLYAYQPGANVTPAMVAEGLLCRQYLGWPASHPGLQAGAQYLLKDWLPKPERADIYCWYYATQVMHHLGGPEWKKWNFEIRNTLLTMQETEGHRSGSWAPRGGAIGHHDTQAGGRIYMTSLAICTLEVYYRHLPIYRAIGTTK